MSLKFKHYISVLLLIIVTHQLFGQRTIETYYDYGKTKLHEVYTTTDEPPYRKHGTYKEFDAVRNLIREKNFKDGKSHGMTKIYYFMPDESQRACYGQLIGESNWKDGKKHGWDKSWDCSNGTRTLREEVNYENGTGVYAINYHRNGVKKSVNHITGTNKDWDENGNLIAEYEVVNGKEEGIKTLYHANGTIKLTGQMINGEESGVWKGYAENGQMILEFDAVVGDPVFSRIANFYDDGSKKSLQYKTDSGSYIKEQFAVNGNTTSYEELIYNRRVKELVPEGLQVSYTEDGQKLYSQTINNGVANGLSEIFNENGEVIGGGNYVNGCRVGSFVLFYDEEWKSVIDYRDITYKREITFDNSCKPTGMVIDYYSDGTKQFEGYLTSIDPDKQDGHCTFYYESGNKKTEATYQHGQINRYIKYYETGHLQMDASYRQGQLHGEVKYYDENGTMRQSEKYNGGLQVGEWRYYSETGKLIEIEEYRFGQLIRTQKVN
ncbi:hypothetical protein N7E81_07255 [Reichenbachiella carrageenanivorans]|uniref:Antitoxin component YwqK of the YwqJK toxin-antitoxin module n=1 Tax=Reichenbachiella carrageenanivorans TaxID=2979869 RepID=A0ABY6D409_9BACT|nr:hypothetical protein [Reichenbachiella carrageenanivorans]UXX80896.1 hypothetical protein N7E81_07255 [Reichenbachiella carrageenanivorans]